MNPHQWSLAKQSGLKVENDSPEAPNKLKPKGMVL